MSLTIRRRECAVPSTLTSQFSNRLASIYASRGVDTPEQLDYRAQNLLREDTLTGIPKAVSLLVTALDENKNIVIVGDFDADGATSTALLMTGMRKMGFTKVQYLVPNRFDYGYGLSPEIVVEAAKLEADLIITVDNGISSLQGAERAKALGIQLLITDHHLPGESLPAADAIVNPNLSGCSFPSKNLAGVGVAFYLMVALRKHLAESGFFNLQGTTPPNLAELLDLVALGTVADVVPLDSNNRILVHQGLQRIRSGQCRPGIQALLQIANREAKSLITSDLGFAVGPRLNAAGRLDDMTIGIQCLMATDTVSAQRYAFQLDKLNRDRREMEADMRQDAEALLEQMDLTSQANSIALFQEHWHQGIVGILAGRIKDQHNRPTVVFARESENTLKGSARSIKGVHIRDLFEELNNRYPGLLLKFGGHAAAAGLSIKEEDFEQFKVCFDQLCQEWVAPELLLNEYLSDGELSVSEFSLEFAEQLNQAGPWGQGFEEPQFDGVFALQEQRIVGGSHLKMVLKGPNGLLLDAIAFNVDTSIWPNTNAIDVELVYKLDINEFRGRRSVQLLVNAIGIR